MMKKIRNPKSEIRKKKAFTLIEILAVIFMSAIIATAGYTIYSMSYQSYKRNMASAELTQNARIALERMTRDIRQAVEILTKLPADPDSGTPPSELKFQDGHNFWPTGVTSPTPSPSPSGQAVGKIQYVTYYLSGTDLHRKLSHFAFGGPTDNNWVLWSTIAPGGEKPTEYTDLDQIKAERVTSLQFWGEETITINLAVSDGTTTYPFQTQVLGRNIQ
jgi:prepilin-type N-terminal cleavage/methylation domain-containing protein